MTAHNVPDKRFLDAQIALLLETPDDDLDELLVAAGFEPPELAMRGENAIAAARAVANAKDAERGRFDMRRDHGYAPGNYSAKCCVCGKRHTADKRAASCVECADAAIAKGAA